MKNKILVESDILFYAFRYALGRRTYAVSDVVEAILEHIDVIPDNDIIVMEKGIAIATLEGRIGDECDFQEWNEVKQAIKEQKTKRNIA